MKRREEFAKAAMQAILASGKEYDSSPTVSYWAVRQADELIAQLNKEAK